MIDDSIVAEKDTTMDVHELAADEAVAEVADDDASVVGLANAEMQSSGSAGSLQEDAVESSGKDEDSRDDDDDDGDRNFDDDNPDEEGNDAEDTADK